MSRSLAVRQPANICSTWQECFKRQRSLFVSICDVFTVLYILYCLNIFQNGKRPAGTFLALSQTCSSSSQHLTRVGQDLMDVPGW